MGPFSPLSNRVHPVLLCALLLGSLAGPMGAQTVTTVAGNATPGYSGDGGPATSAQIFGPGDVAMDGVGSFAFPEAGGVILRRFWMPGATLQRIAGQPSAPGTIGDGGPATLSALNHPAAVVFDGLGNLYLSEFDSHVVRKIDPSGIITRYAGTGTAGYNGDGIPPTSAQLWNPIGLAVDSLNNLYICEYGGHRVRRVNASGTTITTYAGNGVPGSSGNGGPATAASLGVTLERIAVDQADNLYIADASNFMVRRVASASGTITAYAGNGSQGVPVNGANALTQPLDGLDGMTLDCAGNLFLVDDVNHVVRRVDVGSGNITTVAGAGVAGFLDGPALSARFNDPEGITHDRQGNLYLADYENHTIRRVSGVASLCSPVPTATPSGSPTPTPTPTFTLTRTNTSTLTPTRTFTPTSTHTPAGPTLTPTITPTPTSTLTATVTFTPSLSPTLTPVVPPCGDDIPTYAYPNPARGGSVTLHAELCQSGPVKVLVYNTAMALVASFDLNGQAGPADLFLDLAGFSHGVYYYLLSSQGPSGLLKSPVGKFVVALP